MEKKIILSTCDIEQILRENPVTETYSQRISLINSVVQKINTLPLYTEEQVMGIAGWCAAMDNSRPIEELKQEAQQYVNTMDCKQLDSAIKETYDSIEDILNKNFLDID